MPQREPRQPGSTRKPGRPKQAHVASSRERALEYLQSKYPKDEGRLRGIAVWAQVESVLAHRRTKTGKTLQKRILGRIRSLRALVPPLLRLRVEQELESFEREFSAPVEADKRRSVALALLRHAAAGAEELPPMALLAVAISVGCEPPKLTESGQSRLYEAWKKRHAVAWGRVKKEVGALRREEQAAQLARAMTRQVPTLDPKNALPLAMAMAAQRDPKREATLEALARIARTGILGEGPRLKRPSNVP